jgi:hypothetical protein
MTKTEADEKEKKVLIRVKRFSMLPKKLKDILWINRSRERRKRIEKEIKIQISCLLSFYLSSNNIQKDENEWELFKKSLHEVALNFNKLKK